MHDKKDNSKSHSFTQGLRPFAKSLPHGLKKLLKRGGYNFSNIADNWVKMVGKVISNACYPNTIKMSREMNNGTLVLNVIHGNELEIEYSKQEIIDKINAFFGYQCIKEVKLKIVQERKINNETKDSTGIKKIFNSKLENINNEGLKKTLNKLIDAYNAKNN